MFKNIRKRIREHFIKQYEGVIESFQDDSDSTLVWIKRGDGRIGVTFYRRFSDKEKKDMLDKSVEYEEIRGPMKRKQTLKVDGIEYIQKYTPKSTSFF